MIEINIPGRETLRLEHLVSDVNGTLAIDGQLIEGVPKMLRQLRDRLLIHTITADTYGKQGWIDQQLNLTAVRIEGENEAEQKAEYVRELGQETVVAIGQGANDAEMIKTAGLGIVLLSPEGTAVQTLLAADIVTPDIITALELLVKPNRIRATLRK